ncbi:hypothetical protein [Zoogloea sp.]|uniref:hypothetical protein n=1 Tax=Zoogloea sp. TaxID=49181 RepID=UPI0034591266
MPLIISPAAQIGNNCNFSQFLTVGSNHGKAASIDDNVYIGPGVCIVEDVTIGTNCIVGAGAVVEGDVMENSTVVGFPARAVGPNRQPGCVGNHWVSPLERER